MITVVIAADDEEAKFQDTFANVLSSHLPVIQADHYALRTSGAQPEIMVTDDRSFRSIASQCVLIVYKSICEVKVDKTTSNAIAVVDSNNKELVKFVSSTNMPAITCGMSPMDTITLSSIGEDSAVINLQRTVTRFDGELVEPQEIPIHLTGTVSKFLIMATAAVFIVSGNLELLMDAGL